ncbi:uncharacterized protein LOC114259441 isoform X1 [Camellia sinensis]|uniref:uncharacterized protein LOC114259441 isoform X1 n=2 Tax=Camellia sinensis TaxID=4442 RepID=UPI001035DA59|nr:uncharacterized protein LOC114259441 isoform X1 [Camellia sinensis]XP_028055261.1 uncharacterized protein LOC114259441 isoform X1 [Camellia sinensis]
MAHLRGSGNMMIKPKNGTNDSVWSDEPDCIPLKKRRKMLLAIKLISNFADFESEIELNRASISPVDDVHKEEQHYDSQGSNPVCFAREERLSLEQSHAGMPFEYSCQGTEVKEYINSYGTQVNKVNTYAVLVEKVVASASSLPESSMPLKYPVKLEVDYADNNLTSSLINGVEGSLGTYVQAVKMKTEIFDDFVDDLDHIVLKERRRLLLSRKPLKLTKPVLEGDCSLSSKPVVETTIQQSVGMRKGDNHSCAAESSVTGDHTHDVSERNASDFCKTLESGSLNGIIAGSSCTVPHCSILMESCQGIESGKSGMFIGIQGSDRICSSKKASTMYELCGGQNYLSGNPHCMRTSVISSTFVNIKAEPLDYSDVHSLDKSAVCNFPSNSMIPVKSELEIPEEIYGDKLDHMLLRDRIKLLASRDPPNLDNSKNFKCLRKIVPSVRDCSPIVSESSKPLRISRPRKRRKTATDSVETALEEDAPGLLQVLIGKGVSVNEIKLYGEMESDDALDESFSEDGFSELEAVISKLFSQRQSLLKLAPIRCTKGEKASYCLACLISLVEQARYLQFRNWPVEWGWCRDLQSFIFVFKRHNRIVLERPEYGYATYFFELLDFLPINWQIKRLVTAMKLTSCSRVTLIENKALLVGEDLTEGEADVLKEYGWTPNSGLGTMLNYCDRVVHDRKNERDSSEWSSKIGKLLVDGYNRGTIVSTDIPKKAMEYCGGQGPQIKLKL